MPEGGKLTIETGNVRLDDEYAAHHAYVTPGQYVMLAVTDTGAGIPRDTVRLVFDPFFTTKEAGKGSGLGLSMVYGFVKQSGGNVEIYSEVGEGTTVKLYLPRATTKESRHQTPEVSGDEPQGDRELILVVEDDLTVRQLTVAMLRRLGYRTVEAEDADSGLELLDENPDVDLLFTDVVLPGGRNGLEMAQEAQRRRPGLPVLYTSGYTENAIIHHGRLDPGVHLLEKPFSKSNLARKIHELLRSQ